MATESICQKLTLVQDLAKYKKNNLVNEKPLTRILKNTWGTK
jgi:hypothetical protein